MRCYLNAGTHVMRWAVPVFFMMTGALLLKPDRQISVKQCLSKYCLRVVLALFVFGIPFAIMRLYAESEALEPMILLKAVGCVFTNGGLSHFWYLYSIIGIYLLLPALKIVVVAGKDLVRYLLIAMFICVYCFPTLSNFLNVNIAFSMPLTYPVFYVMLGHYLTEYTGKWKIQHCICGIILIVVVIVLTDYYNFAPDVWTTNYSPIVAMLATVVFMMFKNIGQNPLEERKSSRLWTIDRLCFGVYLVHPVFIQFAYRVLKITPLKFDLYPLVTFLFFLVFAMCSFLASWVLSQVKPLKKYIL